MTRRQTAGQPGPGAEGPPPWKRDERRDSHAGPKLNVDVVGSPVRSLCGVGGCGNVRESCRGKERATCYRHRPSHGAPGVGDVGRRRSVVAGRGDCANPACSRAQMVKQHGGRWYLKPFCQPCSRSLSAEEKAEFVPGYGLRISSKMSGRTVLSSGYVQVWVGPRVWVFEHRMVMEGVLGRPLADSETVHHVNGDRGDNRPGNLQLRRGQHGPGQVWCCEDCGSFRVAAVPLAVAS